MNVKADTRLFSHKHIVFCFEHYNPLGIVRTLGENGIKPIIITIHSTGGGIELPSKSKYALQVYKTDSVQKGFDLLLEKFGNENEKPFIYTSDDTIASFLDCNYEKLAGKFFFFNAGENGKITYYMDKNNINVLAEKHGLDVLKAIPLKKGEIREDLEYPVMTKAINSITGGWKDDVFVCNNEDELKEAYEKIRSDTVLVQKYIKKKNELCLDGIAYNHGNDVFITIATNYKYILPKTYSPYMDVSNFNNDELYEKIRGMFKETGFEGVFSMEFLVDQNNSLHFCEINFRNSTWSYASTCCGMPLPILWAETMLNGKLPENSLKEIPSGFTAIVEPADYQIRVLEQKMNFFEWQKEVRHASCRYYYGKNDKKPYLPVYARIVISHFIPVSVKKFIKKVLGK